MSTEASAPVAPERLEDAILAQLEAGPRLVVDLAAAVDQPPALVEGHLRVLRDDGWVRAVSGRDGAVRWEVLWLGDGCNRPAKPWGFEPEDTPELTPEQVALDALEGRLAAVRRLLVHAACTKTTFRPAVRGLATEAEQLHHRVLEGLLAAAKPKEAKP